MTVILSYSERVINSLGSLQDILILESDVNLSIGLTRFNSSGRRYVMGVLKLLEYTIELAPDLGTIWFTRTVRSCMGPLHLFNTAFGLMSGSFRSHDGRRERNHGAQDRV